MKFAQMNINKRVNEREGRKGGGRDTEITYLNDKR